MSYIQDKEKMNKDAEAHKKLVWLVIKITFCTIAAMLLLFCITLVISLIKGDSSKKDTEAPVVLGPSGNVYVGYVGEPPSYKKMISVRDNADKRPQVDVDASGVNSNEVGSYKVHYTVSDASGNVTKYTLTYVVKDRVYSWSQLEALIADKAEELGITSDMSKTEKVRKIYKYVNNDVIWSGGDGESNIPNINRDAWESDWTEEAVRTLERERGDCYSYYSLSKAFFEYFGIENIGIRRAESYAGEAHESTHFWSVVKVEDGWYYYDSTRLKHGFELADNACLITEKQLKSYEGDDTFYKMSKQGIPAISTKELD